METLADIVRDEVRWYAGSGRGAQMRLFYLADEANQTYTVTASDISYDFYKRRPADVIVLARVLGDQVIIEEDTSDKPLYRRLEARGVPPDKIVKVYAGQPAPDVDYEHWP